MKFHPRASLLIDRCVVAQEHGSRLARYIRRILERLFIPRARQS
jgi:hypothetical protein